MNSVRNSNLTNQWWFLFKNLPWRKQAYGKLPYGANKLSMNRKSVQLKEFHISWFKKIWKMKMDWSAGTIDEDPFYLQPEKGWGFPCQLLYRFAKYCSIWCTAANMHKIRYKLLFKLGCTKPSTRGSVVNHADEAEVEPWPCGSSVRFSISRTTISKIFVTWLMYNMKSFLWTWWVRFHDLTGTRHVCHKAFKIVSMVESLKLFYSSYKNRNTMKVTIAVALNGVITYVSELFPGFTSDKDVFKSRSFICQLAVWEFNPCW